MTYSQTSAVKERSREGEATHCFALYAYYFVILNLKFVILINKNIGLFRQCRVVGTELKLLVICVHIFVLNYDTCTT